MLNICKSSVDDYADLCRLLYFSSETHAKSGQIKKPVVYETDALEYFPRKSCFYNGYVPFCWLYSVVISMTSKAIHIMETYTSEAVARIGMIMSYIDDNSSYLTIMTRTEYKQSSADVQFNYISDTLTKLIPCIDREFL